MQQIQIIGNLGADAEIVDFNGAKFVTFRVACSEKITINGNSQEVTTWYSCSYNRAEAAVVQYLKAGQSVFVQGRPSYQLYDSAKYRCKMIDVRVLVDKIQLCGARKEQPAPSQQIDPAPQPKEQVMPF